MRRSELAAASLPSLLIVAGFALLAAACGREAHPSSTARSSSTVAPIAADASYRVRGVVAKLPATPGGEIWLEHESIPDFRDREGKVVGMQSMIMPFGVAADSALADFAVGDRVEFRLELRWRERSPATVGDFRRLPAGTRLEFDEPQPATEAGATPR